MNLEATKPNKPSDIQSQAGYMNVNYSEVPPSHLGHIRWPHLDFYSLLSNCYYELVIHIVPFPN